MVHCLSHTHEFIGHDRTDAFGFTPVRQSVAYRRYEDSRLIVPCYSFWRANECSIAFLPACLWRAAVFVLMLQLVATPPNEACPTRLSLAFGAALCVKRPTRLQLAVPEVLWLALSP